MPRRASLDAYVRALLLAMLSAVAARAATVDAVTPTRGSLMGGTQLTVQGQGFARGGVEGSTLVFVGAELCPVVEYYSTDTQLVCATPPLPRGASAMQQVRVAITSVDRAEFARCSSGPNGCMFSYTEFTTPSVRQMTSAAAPGSLLFFEGALYGRYVRQFAAKVGGIWCDMQLQARGLNTEPLLSYRDGSAFCEVPGVRAGRYKFEFAVSDASEGYGTARFERGTWRTSLHGGEPYTVTVFPRITSLSLQRTGAMGGDPLTITGRGFEAEGEARVNDSASPSPPVVRLGGGAECRVIEFTATRIVCTPDRAPSLPPASAAGARGLLSQRFEGVTGWGLAAIELLAINPQPSEQLIEGNVAASQRWNGRTSNVGDWYVSALTGYFVAPFTANYSFYITGDDYGDVALSPNQSFDSVSILARFTSLTSHYWVQSSQRSEPVALAAGERYAFRVRHFEGSGDDWFKVALRIHDPPAEARSAAQEMWQSISERQIVRFSSAARREVQQVEVRGVASGAFRLMIDGRQTLDIQTNDTAAVLAARLRAVQPCQNLLAQRRNFTDENGDTVVTYNVTFDCAAPSNQRSILVAVNIDLKPLDAQDLSLATRRLVEPSPPIRGVFRVSLDGGAVFSGPIEHDASTTTIANALAALPGTPNVRVSSDGVPADGRTLYLEVLWPAGDVPLVVVDTNDTSGDNVTVGVETQCNGSLDVFMDPVPAELFELAPPEGMHAVELWVDGLKAACSPDSASENGSFAEYSAACAFSYDAQLTPQLYGATAGSSTITQGSVIIVKGSGFANATQGNSVFLVGPAPSPTAASCNVITANATQLQCEVPHLRAGNYSLRVVVRGAGEAMGAGMIGAFVYPVSVRSTSPMVPTEGSLGGGTQLQFFGTGFSASSIVTVGGQLCAPVTCTEPSTLSCFTPASSAAVPVAVAVDGVPVVGQSFSYSLARTAFVSSVSPNAISAGETAIVTIRGQGFSGQAVESVSFGPRSCAVELGGINSTHILCRIVRGPAPPADAQSFQPTVRIATWGIARIEPANSAASTLEIGLRVSSISVAAASLAGGLVITVSGAGFSPRASVRFMLPTPRDPVDCRVLTASYALLECELGAAMSSQEIAAAPEGFALQGTLALALGAITTFPTVNGTAAPCVSSAACSLQFALAATPVVADTAPAAGFAGERIAVRGQRFVSGSTSVTLGGVECIVNEVTSTQVTCTVREDVAGAKNVKVNVVGLGRAASTAAFGLRLQIVSVSNTTSGLGGGVAFTISGSGFSSTPADNVLRLSTSPELLPGEPISLRATRDFSLQGSKFYVDGSTGWLAVNEQDASATAAATFNGDAGVYDLVLRTVGENDGRPSFSLSIDGAELATFRASRLALGNSLETGPDFDLRVPTVTIRRGAVIAVSATVDYSVVDGRYSWALGRWYELVLTPSMSGIAVAVTSSSAHQLVARIPPLPPAATTAFFNASLFLYAQVVGAQVFASASAPLTYVADATPRLLALAPGRVDAPNTVIQVLGTGFGSNFSAHHSAWLGGAACAINAASWNDTYFNCTLAAAPAGRHALVVHVAGAGQALVSTGVDPMELQVTVVASIAVNVTAANASFGGGATVSVTGFGLPLQAAHVSVTVCGAPCVVTAASSSALSCVVPAVATAESLQTFASQRPLVARVEGGAPTGSSSPQRVFDLGMESLGGCDSGLDLGGFRRLFLTRVRFFPAFQNAWRLRGGFVETSVDGLTFARVANFSERPVEGWNVIDLPLDLASPPQRFMRLRGTQGGCQLRELEFIGYEAVNASQCPVDVTVATPATVYAAPPPQVAAEVRATLRAAGAVQYDVASTPVVASVSPTNGSALGGTQLTLMGVGFVAGDLAAHSVEINGQACPVTAATATQLVCTVAERTAIRPNAVSVLVQGRGRALVSPLARFRYLDRWSALTTWRNQEPPVEGDSVVVPEGQTVLLDVSPPRLFLLLVQGELVFDRRDLSLDAFYIFVQGGRFEVGTRAEPFLQRAVITLHGDRRKNVELPHLGAKVLAVSDRKFSNLIGANGAAQTLHGEYRGDLDVHGEPRLRTWTRAAATAEAGQDFVVASEDVDFKAGEKLVVTSSEVDMRQTEEVTVASLDADRRTIRLTAPLRFRHRVQTYSDPQGFHAPVELRFEIALLSRNVIIQGDEETSDRQLFGCHTIAVHGGSYRIENAEIRRCGQASRLGRYPTHLHLAGPVSDSYVESNSIHHTYQRAVTVHGTQYARVANNVAYHTHGHTYFVEDGVERHNTIEGNLGVFTLRTFSSLIGDSRPATFWTASAENFWRHNVAAGCENDGYWFELPSHPHGPSFTTSVCPVGGHIGEFFNNTAHSNGVHGLRVYPTYLPHADPCDSSSPPAAQYMYNFTAYRNGASGIFGGTNGDLHHVGARLIENSGSDYELEKMSDVNYDGNPHIRESLLVGTIDPTRTVGKRAIWGPQNEFFFIADSLFVNYIGHGVISSCMKCGSQTDLKQGGYTVRFRGLRFVNCSQRVAWVEPYKEIFFDLDGSLTGIASGTATPYYGFNEWTPTCTRQGLALDSGLLCDASVRVRRVQIDGVNPREMDFKWAAISSDAGRGRIRFLPKEIYGWVIPMVNQRAYNLTWETLIDWRTLSLRYSEPEYVAEFPGDWTRFTLNYTDYRFNYLVQYNEQRRPWLADRAPLPSDDLGTGFLHADNRSWTVMINTVNTSTAFGSNRYAVDVSALQCPLEGCPVPPPPAVGQATRWSDPVSWDNGRVPQAGEDVTINATRNIILDINPPVLGRLTVLGRLEFDRTGDRSLQAATILVLGELVVGNASAPFLRNAEIVLHGNRNSPTLVVSNEHFLGNKVLAIFGNVSLHGRARQRTWTRLAQTAAAGATSIVVEGPVDWAAGDRIAVTPTEYDVSELESRTIVSVSGASTAAATLVLSAPLQFRHFSGTVSAGGRLVSLRAAVGLLSRNVVVRPATLTPPDRYGAHVVVSDLADPQRADQVRVGRLDARFVEFAQCGKHEMEHAGVLFSYIRQTAVAGGSQSPENRLQGCAFSDSLNYGMVAERASNLWIEGNVFHRTFRSAVDVDTRSLNAYIVGNLVAGALRSPDETTDWVRPMAAFFINAPVRALRGNVAGGSSDIGFVFAADRCGTASASISDNEAHGALVGGWIMSQDADCLQVSGFTAWKCAHVGLLTVDQTANVQIANVSLADNHIGVSLNFIRGATGSFAALSESVVLGSTAASTCEDSLICRAQSEADPVGVSCGSVWGSQFRRVGIMTSQYTNRGKTCMRDSLPVCRPLLTPERLCSLPWEKRYGLPSTRHAELRVSNTVLGSFNAGDCGLRSVAVAVNPSNPDYTPPLRLSGITWQDVPRDARFLLRSSRGECETACDAANFVLVHDMDGSAAGRSYPTTILGNNPTVAAASPRCVGVTEWGGFECNGTRSLMATLESMDRDRDFRSVGPFTVVRNPNVVEAETRSSFAVGPFDDNCAKRFRFAQFPMMLEANRTFFISSPATMPLQTRLWLHSTSASDVVVASIVYSSPFVIEVEVGGRRAPRVYSYEALLLSSNPAAGTYLFDPQLRALTIALRGAPGQPTPYDLYTRPAVQLTIRMAADLDTFFGERVVENIALLLGIPPERIKVVDVRRGSVILDLLINDEAGLLANETSASVQRLNVLAAALVDTIRNGSLAAAIQYQIISASVTPASADGSATPFVFGGEEESESWTSSSAAIAVFVCVALVAAALVVLGVVLFRRRHRGKADDRHPVLDMDTMPHSCSEASLHPVGRVGSGSGAAGLGDLAHIRSPTMQSVEEGGEHSDRHSPHDPTATSPRDAPRSEDLEAGRAAQTAPRPTPPPLDEATLSALNAERERAQAGRGSLPLPAAAAAPASLPVAPSAPAAPASTSTPALLASPSASPAPAHRAPRASPSASPAASSEAAALAQVAASTLANPSPRVQQAPPRPPDLNPEELQRIIRSLGDVKEEDFAQLPAHFVVTESLQRPEVHRGDIVFIESFDRERRVGIGRSVPSGEYAEPPAALLSRIPPNHPRVSAIEDTLRARAASVSAAPERRHSQPHP